MISDFEKSLIERLQFEEDLSACVRIAAGSDNPDFLAEYARSYNWDDGYDIANAVADNLNCDKGTALSLFWLAEAMCYLTKEVRRNECNAEWADFCEKIIRRLTDGYYELGPVSFDPNIGRVQEYKFKKQGIPSVFYTKVVGVPRSTDNK